MSHLTRQEVLQEIGRDSAIGNRRLHDAFEKITQHKHVLNRPEAKQLASVACRNDRVSTREALSLLKIAQYQYSMADAARYLTRFCYFHNGIKRGRVFGRRSPAQPVVLSDAEEREHIETLMKASSLRVAFTLPDIPGYLYRFTVLGTVAGLLRHGLYEQFGYIFAAGEAHGLISSGHDFMAIDHADMRKTYHRLSTVVHEGMHIWQDASGVQSDLGHAEVGAHLTQAIWLRAHKRPLYGRLLADAFSDTADDIADDLSGKSWVVRVVDWDTYRAMRAALCPPYKPKEKTLRNHVDFWHPIHGG